jgi:hypothetical protein
VHIVATDGALEVHLIPGKFVSASEVPLTVLPTASNCMGTPNVAIVCVDGITVTVETSLFAQLVHEVTVKVALLLTISPLNPGALAVIFVIPVHPSPVAGL